MKLPGIFLLFVTCGLAAASMSPEDQAREVVIKEKAPTVFELLPLAYDSSGRAPFHIIDPNTRYFDYKGNRYFGFRFVTPAVIDGDFGWMFLLKPKDGPVSIRNSGWYILRRNGPMTGFRTFDRRNVADYPEVAAQFPHTKNITVQSLPAENFLPNEEYIMWFMLPLSEPRPQHAVAFSFAPRATAWTARLPLGRKKVVPSSSTPTSIEGDPW
jgi:hypothetical protein